MNNKGMLGNLIGGFIAIIIGISLIGTISNQIDLAINCNNTNQTIEYYGPTDSFGGGGTEHFGGYDGKVSHKSFLSNADILTRNSNSSMIGCVFQDSSTASNFSVVVLQTVPFFFAIVIMLTVFGIVYSSIRNVSVGEV